MAFDTSAIGSPVDERYPQELAAQSAALLEAALPGLVLRPGSPEAVIVEALALAAAQVSNAANETIGAVVETILTDFYQVPRSPGAPSVGGLTVTFDSSVTTTIPAGTGFSLADYGVEVATTATVNVTASTTAVLQVATVEATTLVNGVTAGAAVDVLDVIPNLLSVAVTTTFSGGADPETDDAYIARARNRLARVTNSLVVADHFTAYVLEDGRAVNALTIPAWNGTNVATIGTDAGNVTVVTYGAGGNLAAGVRTDLKNAMQAITYTGCTVNVNAASTTSVNVTVSVSAAPGYTAAEAQAQATDAIRAFLAPETWKIGDDVLPAALSAAISDAAAVQFVASMTTPAATVTIPADGVPTLGTISVSVV